MKDSIKNKLLFMLMDLLPELVFDEYSFKRNMASNIFNEQPKWEGGAMGYNINGEKIYIHFNGRDTMKDIVKRGVDLHVDAYRYYDVYAK